MRHSCGRDGSPRARFSLRRGLPGPRLKRGRFFALVACDVHECGFVAGAGLAAAREEGLRLSWRGADVFTG